MGPIDKNGTKDTLTAVFQQRYSLFVKITACNSQKGAGDCCFDKVCDVVNMVVAFFPRAQGF